MDHFQYRERKLHCEGVSIDELARIYGTPLYVYSEATLVHHLEQIQKAFAEADPLIGGPPAPPPPPPMVSPISTVGRPITITPPWAVGSPIRAAG